jgi:hypothetical protein
MLRDDDIRVDVGRCTGGTFLRVVHLPTGVSRSVSPLGGEAASVARGRLLAEVERELTSRGLSGTSSPREAGGPLAGTPDLALQRIRARRGMIVRSGPVCGRYAELGR